MSIATYSELLADVESYADRSDFPFASFLAKVEATVNRRLRDPNMETSVTLTGDGADLPADFGEMISIGTADGHPLSLMANGEYAALLPSSGISRYYTIREGGIYYYPGSANVTLVYRRRVPALTEASPTNWLLSLAPDVYSRGCMFEECVWERDTQAAQGWKALFDEAIDEMISDGLKRKWGAGPIAPRIRRT